MKLRCIAWFHNAHMRSIILSAFATSLPRRSVSPLPWTDHWSRENATETRTAKAERQWRCANHLATHLNMLLDANDKELLDFFAEEIGTVTAIVIKYDHKTSPAQKVFMQIFLSRMPAESIEKYNAAFEREKTTDRSHMPARGAGSLTSAARSLASSGTTALSTVATSVGLSTNTSPNTAD